MSHHCYTAEFMDNEERTPYWCVIEWNSAQGTLRSGNLLERHASQLAAESAASMYNLIYSYAN